MSGLMSANGMSKVTLPLSIPSNGGTQMCMMNLPPNCGYSKITLENISGSGGYRYTQQATPIYTQPETYNTLTVGNNITLNSTLYTTVWIYTTSGDITSTISLS